MFEHRRKPLLPPREFRWRLTKCAVVAALIVALSLAFGSAGFRAIEGWDWIDALHHSAMLLTGMGPVVQPISTAGKLFDSAYALFSGVVFLTIAALLLAPIAHRVLHRFHLETGDDAS